MLLAILNCTNCSGDLKKVFSLLSGSNVELIKTRNGISTYPEITIRVKDLSDLNSIIHELNQITFYGVSVKRTRKCWR